MSHEILASMNGVPWLPDLLRDSKLASLQRSQIEKA